MLTFVRISERSRIDSVHKKLRDLGQHDVSKSELSDVSDDFAQSTRDALSGVTTGTPLAVNDTTLFQLVFEDTFNSTVPDFAKNWRSVIAPEAGISKLMKIFAFSNLFEFSFRITIRRSTVLCRPSCYKTKSNF